ncbi:Competence protein F homolog, phosphoribosyltransferase domain; protein YhgH required for utilization of DNA as sole source of carbon and energy [hydrothermal vent metagenome]|uniref:Competence protein F homolog, phosphoribosyltransferase domain protein YhgH required for utilization of DNA as sole source of carbon and energy n=1 Tax=hydrothermal vent metagenome TaxID=652676 RepID=A0A3B0XW28_9ZZZZ
MNKLLDFIYPPRCQLCGSSQNLADSGQICTHCAADFPINNNACQRCAEPLGVFVEVQTAPRICGSCCKNPPIYDFCYSPFIYAQPLEWVIQQLKFSAKINFAPLLSQLMAARLTRDLTAENTPDVIIPMPLHKRRIKQRGFNQSHLLIKPVAKKLNLSIDLNAGERVRDTQHQTGKNARQRRDNIKNAFRFNNKKNYQHVVIFDDVVTTGSSVSELSKTLKKTGVKRVDVWCLARAEKFK